MIHEIAPYSFNNTYKHCEPNDNDYIICLKNKKIFLSQQGSKSLMLPTFKKCLDNEMYLASYKYLFSINSQAFFLVQDLLETDKIKAIDIEENIFRLNKHLRYAVTIALQLHSWYQNNKYCGCCGASMAESRIERKMECSHCGNMVYPKISPVIMVGIYCKDYLLVTKYADREYSGYSLVAGFVEIGETLEEAVKREVKEEVGLQIDSIVYFNSQPWGLSSSLMVGFWATAKKDCEIQIDTNELSEAKWVHKSELPFCSSPDTLAYEMINQFCNQEL